MSLLALLIVNHKRNIIITFFSILTRYSYDPYTQSLNEFPEAELQVTAGDYVLVWGDSDEDGFFEGKQYDIS